MQDLFERWTHEEVSNTGARLGVENGWFAEGKKLVHEEISLFVHPASTVSRAIDVELSWTPIDQPLTLLGAPGKSYGGINFHAAPRTKTIITSAEGRSADDVLMTRLPWADISGDFAGGMGFSGVAIFVPPEHPDYAVTYPALKERVHECRLTHTPGSTGEKPFLAPMRMSG